MILVRSKLRDYAVLFGDLDGAFGEVNAGDVLITDSHLAELYPKIREAFDKVVVVEAGEKSKSFEVYQDVVRQVARLGLRRNGRVYAFGGGVVGDLAGFVAASYMRGVELVQVPTSLLAMVDSSVGGKVGIDLPEGKNLVGAFWPPHKVLICPEVLETLPRRQYVNGAAEVWKYGYIMDREFLGLLRQGALEASRLEVISHCVDLKRQVVMEDEDEKTGRRAILNFGHTVGHAIEKVLNYEELLHGEAIAIGMVVEAELGEEMGVTPRGTAEEIRADLAKVGLPVALPAGLDREEIVGAMSSDKKRSGDELAFSLLEELGQCKLFDTVPSALVSNFLAKL